MPIIGSSGSLKQFTTNMLAPKNQLFINTTNLKWSGTSPGLTTVYGDFKMDENGDITQVGIIDNTSTYSFAGVDSINDTISKTNVKAPTAAGGYITAAAAGLNGDAAFGFSYATTFEGKQRCAYSMPIFYNGVYSSVSNALLLQGQSNDGVPVISKMVIDNTGSLYIGGFGAQWSNVDGGTEPMIVKISSTFPPAIEWQGSIFANPFNFRRSGNITSLTVDENGNTFIIGFNQGRSTQEGPTLTNAFTMQLYWNGTVAWCRNQALGNDLAVVGSYLYASSGGYVRVIQTALGFPTERLYSGSPTMKIVVGGSTFNSLTSNYVIACGEPGASSFNFYVYSSARVFLFSGTLTTSSGSFTPHAVSIDPMGAIVFSVATDTGTAIIRILANGTITGDGIYPYDNGKTLTYTNLGTQLVSSAFGTWGTSISAGFSLGEFTQTFISSVPVTAVNINKYDFTND